MQFEIDDSREWLEPDGLGGFASGTTTGIRTRRYHALLLTATTPPTGRMVLVNGADVRVETPAGSFALSSQRYAPGVVHPDGASRITGFSADPWPTWDYVLPDGTHLRQELLVEHGVGRTVLVWTLVSGERATLEVRPFLSGRDYHGTHHENAAFRFDAEQRGAMVRLEPYDGVPPVVCLSDGSFTTESDWYRQFMYTSERDRGLDDTEDLAAPGVFRWQLATARRSASLILSAGLTGPTPALAEDVAGLARSIQDSERRRRAGFSSRLDRSADAYLVRRGDGRTIVAGYPWFTDWGRDTFIALRGLCLAAGRLADARDILVEWASAVSEGMLPNRFADSGEAPEYNAVDASLWYVVAVGELLEAVGNRRVLTASARKVLRAAVERIVEGYAAGTRFGIRMDHDGLLAAGVPGVQLTWMDARVGDRVITPRIGKPIEVQALWANALAVAGRFEARWLRASARATQAVVERFWNEQDGRLADVVDVDHVAGTRDDTFRPNQILAVGGLPVALVDGPRGRRIVDAVERALVTPLGLRSLAPTAPGYAPRYEGNGAQRDEVYHQGTVWPWLMGPFVDAWIRVRGGSAEARLEARSRFVEPLLAHLDEAGLGHVSEIADAEAPFTPRGCPFQAWSVGELVRLERWTAPVDLQQSVQRSRRRDV